MLDMRDGSSSVSLSLQQNLFITAVETSNSSNRDVARLLVRKVLTTKLSEYIACPPEAVRLISIPGRPLYLDHVGSNIGLSVSHERGLSLAAIHVAGHVGIDLMQVSQAPDHVPEILHLAKEYLGPDSARQLAALPQSELVIRFAEHWTMFEASLKCLGIGLDEWTPVLQKRLDECRSIRLRLPAGYVGAVALPRECAVTFRELFPPLQSGC